MTTSTTRVATTSDSSIHILPYDILLIIFTYLLRQRLGQGNNRPAPPWLVSTVCKRWREFAISNPSLWANIIFQPYPDGLSNITLEALVLQLERARNSTLDMAIDLVGLDPDTFESSLRGEFQVLARNLTRCHALELRGVLPPSWTLPSDLDGAPLFASLKTLAVDNPRWIHGNIFRNAPALVNLNLEGPVTLTSSLPLAWGNLNRLTLKYCVANTPQVVLEVLRCAAPRLQVLVIHILEYTDRAASQNVDFSEALPSVSLPKLRELHVFGSSKRWNGSMHREVVAQLQPQRLRKLHLQEDGIHLLSPLSKRPRVSATLTDLILEGPIWEDPDVMAALSRLSSLQALCVIGPFNDRYPRPHSIDFLLATLQLPGSSISSDSRSSSFHEDVSTPVTWPSLTRIVLKQWELRAYELEAMVRSRTSHLSESDRIDLPCRLKEMHLEDILLNGAGGENLGWLKEMMEEGVLKGSVRARGVNARDRVWASLGNS